MTCNMYLKSFYMKRLNETELQKIKTNLYNLIDFNSSSYENSNKIISEVYHYLNSVKEIDCGADIFNEILSEAFLKVSDIPEGSGISWFLLGLLNSYNKNIPSTLDEDLGDIRNRYHYTYSQMYNDLTEMYNDPITNLDRSFNIPFCDLKKITLRDLLNFNIPSKDDLLFEKCLTSHTRGFRSSLCKQELPKENKLEMIYVSYYNGNGYVPGTSTLEILYPFAYNYENGPLIVDNFELWANNDKVTKVEFENNELDYDTFIETAGFFNHSQPQSFIVPWGNQESLYLYGKYYLMQHFTKSKDWKLAKASLCNWLFIDDGFGNIINPDGCGMREDVVRNWGIKNGDKIPTEHFSLNSINFLQEKKETFTKNGVLYKDVTEESNDDSSDESSDDSCEDSSEDSSDYSSDESSEDSSDESSEDSSDESSDESSEDSNENN